jgi:hypothetical protein
MGRSLVVGVAVVFAIAGLAWVVWAIGFRATPVVHSQIVSYRVRGEHAVTATFSVVRDDRGVQASCQLRAVASDHAVVGEVNVPVGRTAAASATVRKSIRTDRRATTVDLVGCTAPGQKQPN